MNFSQLNVWELNWVNSTPSHLAAKLTQEAFDNLKGETSKGIKYRTLFLSTELCKNLSDTTPLDTFISKGYQEQLLSSLEKIDQNFTILGSCRAALPSVMPLATIKLALSFAVFCFVVVQDTPFLEEKLKRLGLEKLLQENEVQTLPLK